MLGVLRLYGSTAALAARRGLKAWPVAFSLALYAAIVLGATRLVGPLGPVGGFILGMVVAACLSSYLHLISLAVAGSRLRFDDLRKSFGARFWDVISVLFVFWIIGMVLPYLAAPFGDKAPVVLALAGVAMAMFFNPVPELLYLGSSRSVQLLLESARFIQRNGLEWLVPNVLFALALLAPLGVLHGPMGQIVLTVTMLLAPDKQGMPLLALYASAPLPLQLGMLLFVHWAMLFRGILWKELSSGGARRRAVHDAWRR